MAKGLFKCFADSYLILFVIHRHLHLPIFKFVYIYIYNYIYTQLSRLIHVYTQPQVFKENHTLWISEILTCIQMMNEMKLFYLTSCFMQLNL